MLGRGKTETDAVLASINKRFPGVGTFVEFGGFDGVALNITHHLARRMWRGYFTEPIPRAYLECRRNYANNPRVVVDNVAIGDSDGWLRMHLSGASSTGCDAFHRHTEFFFKKAYDEELEVRMTTLNNFLEKHSVPGEFELLVVDVEGMEWEVFRGFDIKKWRPKAILVELHEILSDWEDVGEHYRKVEEFIVESGYYPAIKGKVNTLFYGS